MGEAKRRKAAVEGHAKIEDIVLTKQMTLPQRVLDKASQGMDGLWRIVEALRQDPLLIAGVTGPWNSWCYLPVNAMTGAIAMLYRDQMTPAQVEAQWMHKSRLISATGAWRMTKGVYVFDPEVAKSLVDSEVEEDLPDELFLHMPDWCPYISTPGLKVGEGLFIHGFFAYVDDRAYGNRQHFSPELNFEIMVDPHLSSVKALGPIAIVDQDIQAAILPKLDEGLRQDAIMVHVCELARQREYIHLHMNVPLGQGKFSKAFLEQTKKVASIPNSYMRGIFENAAAAETMHEVTQFFGKMQARLGALLLYLVSDKADISPESDAAEVRDRIVLNERRGIRNFQSPKVKPWEVGFRIGAEIRSYETKVAEAAAYSGTGSTMRPHVRRAHWHSFWTGPRDQPALRRKRVRWLPPTPVNVTTSDDLVPTMHKVVIP